MCSEVGFVVNWEKKTTVKAISGLVVVISYIRELIASVYHSIRVWSGASISFVRLDEDFFIEVDTF